MLLVGTMASCSLGDTLVGASVPQWELGETALAWHLSPAADSGREWRRRAAVPRSSLGAGACSGRRSPQSLWSVSASVCWGVVGGAVDSNIRLARYGKFLRFL